MTKNMFTTDSHSKVVPMDRAILPRQAGSSSCLGRNMQRISGQRIQPFKIQPACKTARRVVLRAENNDDDFEANLKRIREAKGKTPYGESRKPSTPQAKEETGTSTKPKQYDFSGEKLHFEGPPHRGDLAVNIAFGATLLWLPLTFAALGRAAFVKYRFTDKRLSVITNAPWKNEQLDAAYQEVKNVVTVGRGLGIWGDMVVTLRNNDKIELRSLPQFQELKKYILERRDELQDSAVSAVSGGRKTQSGQKGFSS